MKKAFAVSVPYLTILIFGAYWVICFILCLPPNPVKNNLVKNAPVVNKWLGNTWSFFAPPHHYNDKLYLIFPAGNRNDTMELLSVITRLKQEHIPFNQKENITDHLVNHYVTELKHVLYQYKYLNTAQHTDSTSTFYQPATVNAAMKNEEFFSSFQTLQHFCNRYLRSKNLIKGTGVNMVLAQDPIGLVNEGKQIFPTKELIICSLSYNYE